MSSGTRPSANGTPRATYSNRGARGPCRRDTATWSAHASLNARALRIRNGRRQQARRNLLLHPGDSLHQVVSRQLTVCPGPQVPAQGQHRERRLPCVGSSQQTTARLLHWWAVLPPSPSLVRALADAAALNTVPSCKQPWNLGFGRRPDARMPYQASREGLPSRGRFDGSQGTKVWRQVFESAAAAGTAWSG